MSKWHREFMAHAVEQTAEPFTVPYVHPAFNGDTEAAFSLACSLNNDKRGSVAVAMWQAKVARPAFRVFLAAVWGHDHSHLIAAAGTRRRLAAMFRYAAFPPPEHLPPVVKVWRGTNGMNEKEAVQGYSWTIDRDIACWFALRFDHRGQPLVIAADVPRENVAYFSNERSEQEVMLFKPPQSVWIDGAIDDWRMGYAHNSERIQASNRAGAAA
ncbi:hypothetical protein [Eoetvoesiella caeni]